MGNKTKETEAVKAPHLETSEEFFSDPGSSTTKRERPQGKTIVSGAEFYDFEKNPVFVGKYLRDVVREKDGKNAATNPNEKAGSVMGYLFQAETGDETIIGNSFSIQKALQDPKNREVTLWIEFEGKTEIKGKPFNRFHIQTVD